MDTPGGRLILVIKQSGLTQNAFAKMLGTGPSYVSMIVAGKRPMTRPFALRVANAAGIDYEWLLTGKGEMMARPPMDGKELHDVLERMVNVMEQMQEANIANSRANEINAKANERYAQAINNLADMLERQMSLLERQEKADVTKR